MIEFSEDEEKLIESELNYISKKRSTRRNGENFTCEISMNINPELGLEKCSKFLERQLRYELQQDVEYARSRFGKID